MQSLKFVLNFSKIKRIVLFFICPCFFLLYFNAAYAGYAFDRTGLELSAKQPIDTIKFTNPGKDMPVSLQVKIVQWTQKNGNDVYQPTKDLVVSPPQLQILPGKTRLVRVGWRTPGPISQERAYRMIVADLTPYKKQPNTVILKLQINIPVFIEPENVVMQAQWQVKRSKSNAVNVLVTNTGNIHLKISKITLTNANNEVIASQPTAFSILPGQSKQGSIGLTQSLGQSVNIVADTSKGKLNATVNVL